MFKQKYPCYQFDIQVILIITCGEGGIRTPGTSYPVRQFSKLLVSATHPPLLKACKNKE